MDFQIIDCVANDDALIEDNLVKYNISQVPKTQEKPLLRIQKKIVDANNHLIGGCLSVIYCWKIMYIEILWIDEAYRRHGLGTRLLKEMERISAEHDCSLIHLDTFDFQAKDFYIKHGFEVFGVLENCPENHCRYYLKKNLK